MSKATTGVPTARASAATIPNVSYRLGMATRSAPASQSNRSSARYPPDEMDPVADPQLSGPCRSRACRSGPSPPRTRSWSIARATSGERLEQQVQTFLGDLQASEVGDARPVAV